MMVLMIMMILENDGDDVDDISWWSDGAELSGVHLLQRQKAAGSGLGNHQARSRPQSHC